MDTEEEQCTYATNHQNHTTLKEHTETTAKIPGTRDEETAAKEYIANGQNLQPKFTWKAKRPACRSSKESLII